MHWDLYAQFKEAASPPAGDAPPPKLFLHFALFPTSLSAIL